MRMCSTQSRPMTDGNSQSPRLEQSVSSLARRDFITLRRDLTIAQALQSVREKGVGEKIIYFYVVDEEDRLAGVLPTRRLLIAPLDQRLSEIMVPRVVSIPHSATVLEACEAFILYKFLAFPVVDDGRRIVGVVDVGLFTEEVLDYAQREQTDAAFEAIGLHMEQVRQASPVLAFRFRIPWLLATITSGMICAVLAGAFEATLAESIVLAFFLTLVLGLGESVATQSLTVTIQTLRGSRPTLAWFKQALRREFLTGAMLAATCASLVGVLAWLWRGQVLPALVIGGGIFLSISAACLVGLSVPALLHAVRLDPKIAAGPISLALADILTLLFYFTLATVIL